MTNLIGKKFIRTTTQTRDNGTKFTFIQQIEVIKIDGLLAEYKSLNCNIDPITGTKLLGGFFNINHLDEMIASGRLTPFTPITSENIKEGAKFQCDKIVWIIDKTQGDTVSTSMEYGEKGRYKDDMQTVVDFLNEENAVII